MTPLHYYGIGAVLVLVVSGLWYRIQDNRNTWTGTHEPDVETPPDENTPPWMRRLP